LDGSKLEPILEEIRLLAASERVRITQHAHQEMIEEAIRLDDVLEAIRTAEILESYPEHRRGPCCLLNGSARTGRPLHIVCTTARPLLIVITVYEPKLPKWISATQRRPR